MPSGSFPKEKGAHPSSPGVFPSGKGTRRAFRDRSRIEKELAPLARERPFSVRGISPIPGCQANLNTGLVVSRGDSPKPAEPEPV